MNGAPDVWATRHPALGLPEAAEVASSVIDAADEQGLALGIGNPVGVVEEKAHCSAVNVRPQGAHLGEIGQKLECLEEFVGGIEGEGRAKVFVHPLVNLGQITSGRFENSKFHATRRCVSMARASSGE